MDRQKVVNETLKHLMDAARSADKKQYAIARRELNKAAEIAEGYLRWKDNQYTEWSEAKRLMFSLERLRKLYGELEREKDPAYGLMQSLKRLEEKMIEQTKTAPAQAILGELAGKGGRA